MSPAMSMSTRRAPGALGRTGHLLRETHGEATSESEPVLGQAHTGDLGHVPGHVAPATTWDPRLGLGPHRVQQRDSWTNPNKV